MEHIITKKEYLERLEGTIAHVSGVKDTVDIKESPTYYGSLGGQLTILKRELEFLKTHKIIEEPIMSKDYCPTLGSAQHQTI